MIPACLLTTVRSLRAFLLGLAIAGIPSSLLFALPDVAARPNQKVPLEYFGLHMHRSATTTAWPAVPFGTWRLMDAYVDWPRLEPEKGRWQFEMLDKYVELAQQHNVRLLLPLAFSPAWASVRPEEPSAYRPGNAAEPRKLDDWRAYVRTVATRYRGRITEYEIWNEPNLKKFYTGNTTQLVALAREAYSILKEVDRSNLLVSPSVTGDGKHLDWLDDYLANGGGNYADVIGYHFYTGPHPPETMLPLITKVRNIMAKHGLQNKPLWNTESGWLIANDGHRIDPAVVAFPRAWEPLSMDQAAAYLARALILARGAGLGRYYWYAWDNEAMGLLEPSTQAVKRAATGYRQTVRWLEGSVLGQCQTSGSIWLCPIARAERRAWLAWRASGNGRWAVPATMNVIEHETLDGRTEAVNPSGSPREVEVGSSPILLKTDSLPWVKS